MLLDYCVFTRFYVNATTYNYVCMYILLLAYQIFSVSCEESSYKNCHSVINLKFICLTQKIQTMVKPLLLLENCNRLMASKTYSTPLFQKDFLKGFYTITDKPSVLFQALGIFWTWSDHSILKELLHMGECTEAIALLNKFDQHLGCFKSIPIEQFPLPVLSSRMIPVDTKKQAHTILAIKYNNPYNKCTWHNIVKVCNLLKDIFEITRNTMQLLGVLNDDSEFSLIYLMIPTSVIPLITSKITHVDCHSLLVRNSVMEVAIYLKTLYSANAKVRVAPLAFFMDISSKHIKVSSHLATYIYTVVNYMHVCMYVCTYVSMYVCMYVCM